MPQKPTKKSHYDEKSKEGQYIVDADRDLFNLVEYVKGFPKVYTQATQPTIPTDSIALWDNTTTGHRFWIWSTGGTQNVLDFAAAGGSGVDHSLLSNLSFATAGHTGFQAEISSGNLTGAGPISVAGGDGAVMTGGASISIAQANTSQSGYISATDWGTFDAKEPAIATGTTAQYWRGDKSFQDLNIPDTGNLVTTSSTGNFVIYSITDNFVASSYTSNFVATSATANFVTYSVTDNFVASGYTSNFVYTSATGNFVTYSVTNNFVASSYTSNFVTYAVTDNFVASSYTSNFVATSGTAPFVIYSVTNNFVASSYTSNFVATSGTAPFVIYSVTNNFVASSSTGNLLFTAPLIITGKTSGVLIGGSANLSVTTATVTVNAPVVISGVGNVLGATNISVTTATPTATAPLTITGAGSVVGSFAASITTGIITGSGCTVTGAGMAVGGSALITVSAGSATTANLTVAAPLSATVTVGILNAASSLTVTTATPTATAPVTLSGAGSVVGSLAIAITTGAVNTGIGITVTGTGKAVAGSINVAFSGSVNAISSSSGIITSLSSNVVATPAVAFPAVQSASADVNILDDYEEGTWDATVTCGTSGTITLLAAQNQGRYTKIGRTVTISGAFVVTSVSSPVGYLQVNGLPFSSAAGDELDSFTGIALHTHNLNVTGTTSMIAFIPSNSAIFWIEHFTAGLAADAAADFKATSQFIINATYTV